MPSLPNTGEAILELRKLEDYCLDSTHPRGRHKARVFRQALGLERGDAHWLREALLAAVHDIDAAALMSDVMGVRWRVDVPLTRHGRSAVVRTIWIMRTDEGFPRFVTCWVL
jgi:hypothetical protein